MRRWRPAARVVCVCVWLTVACWVQAAAPAGACGVQDNVQGVCGVTLCEEWLRLWLQPASTARLENDHEGPVPAAPLLLLLLLLLTVLSDSLKAATATAPVLPQQDVRTTYAH